MRLIQVIFLMTMSTIAYANDPFNLQTLPRGKEITLPRPALTLVPVSESVRLASTDLPQTLKLSHQGAGGAFKIAIYDKTSPKVKHVELRPGMNYLYNFQQLGSINIVPEKSNVKTLNTQTLRIESNKPLTISR